MENTREITPVTTAETSTLVMPMRWGKVLVRASSAPLSSFCSDSLMPEDRSRSASCSRSSRATTQSNSSWKLAA